MRVEYLAGEISNLNLQGYEMRQYQSVNWVCTEATYKMEREPEMFRKLFR